MMRRLDTDRDGKLTRAEFMAGVDRRFARADLDSDGKITDADLPPFMRGRDVLSGEDRIGRRRGRGMRMLRMLRGADTDGNGEITKAEATAHAEKRFARFDRNSDGTVDEADREAFQNEMRDYRVKRFLHRFGAAESGEVTREAFLARASERFERRDLDGDGVLSRREMRRGKRWGRGRGHHGWRKHHRGHHDGPGHDWGDDRASYDEREERGERRGPQGISQRKSLGSFGDWRPPLPCLGEGWAVADLQGACASAMLGPQ